MAELLLRNARIWTGDAATPWAEAALVQNGRFAFAGRERDLNAPAGVATLDAEGRLVLPGFTDGHAHLLNTGLAMRAVDLKGVASVEEAARRVA
ncbi:MAG: amidohydrolase family protein, partial [Chloroflexi bacterium]|nr:amidohydrolase family protein [Chloroflexota bacterium]